MASAIYAGRSLTVFITTGNKHQNFPVEDIFPSDFGGEGLPSARLFSDVAFIFLDDDKLL